MFSIVLRLIGYVASFGLLLLLGACNLLEEPPPSPSSSPSSSPPRLTSRPIATPRPTRAALVTLTSAPLPSVTEPVPSATPDPNVLSEVFVTGGEVLSFRHPAGWEISDQSDESEILIKAQSGALSLSNGWPGAEVNSILVVNLLNARGDVTTEAFEALADTYLRNLLLEEFDTMTLSYRQEGDSLIATAIRATNNPIQFEVRFSSRAPFYQVLTLIAPPDKWEQVAPTLDAMARSVAVNREMGAEVATPAAATRLSEGLALQNASFYQARTGALFVVGEIFNHGQQAYEDVQVMVWLVDRNEREIVREAWPIERKLLPSGERSPFVAIFNPPPEDWANFKATVEALPADFYAQRITNAFEINDVTSFTPSAAAYGLTAIVKNLGPDARAVKVTAALYNQTGNVLAVSRTTLTQSLLLAEQEAPIDLIFYHQAPGEPVRYEIWIEGTLVQ
ncbi:MAG: hypothetical protein ACPGWR_17045 [Ardenticatenaceae bacterium]